MRVALARGSIIRFWPRQRLYNSFLVISKFLLRNDILLPRIELHWSLWVFRGPPPCGEVSAARRI